MIIRCIENMIDKICTEKLEGTLYSIYKRLEGADESLKKGRFYIVYSLFETKDSVWFMIKTDTEIWYPSWYPSSFFEIINDDHSQCWVESNQYGVGPVAGMGKLYSFPEYITMDCFYHNLVDASEIEVKTFERYIRKMRDEAIF